MIKKIEIKDIATFDHKGIEDVYKRQEVFLMAHNRLMNESLANRDKKWTTSVNGIYDSLCSLVKQVSSQEKEDDDTVGQYGTAVSYTHLSGKSP